MLCVLFHPCSLGLYRRAQYFKQILVQRQKQAGYRVISEGFYDRGKLKKGNSMFNFEDFQIHIHAQHTKRSSGLSLTLKPGTPHDSSFYTIF